MIPLERVVAIKAERKVLAAALTYHYVANQIYPIYTTTTRSFRLPTFGVGSDGDLARSFATVRRVTRPYAAPDHTECRTGWMRCNVEVSSYLCGPKRHRERHVGPRQKRTTPHEVNLRSSAARLGKGLARQGWH